MKGILTSITAFLLKMHTTSFYIFCGKCSKKRLGIAVLLILLLCMIILGRMRQTKLQNIVCQGPCGSQTYHMEYRVKGGANYQKEIDHLLLGMLQEVDVRDVNSALSVFNRHDCIDFSLDSTQYLYNILAKGKKLHHATQGSFDLTIMPLATLWKNHLWQGTLPSEAELRAIRSDVGLDYIMINPQRIKKLKEKVTVDLSDVIVSYGVDLIVDFLKSKGIQHFTITIGMTSAVQGTDKQFRPWQVGHTIAPVGQLIEGRSVCSQLTHSAICKVQQGPLQESENLSEIFINPQTGQLVQGEILAVIVYANDGLTARAYATKILMTAPQEVMAWVEQTKDVEALWLYYDEEGLEQIQHSAGIQITQKEGEKDMLVTRCF